MGFVPDSPPNSGRFVPDASAAPAAPAEAPKKSLLHHILDYAVNQNPAIGAIEEGVKIGSGVLAQIPAGLAGLGNEATNALGLTHNEPADTVRSVEDATTYKPQSDAAHQLEGDAAATGRAIAPVVKPVLNKAGELADATGQGPLIRAGADVLPKMAAVLVPGARALAPESAALDASALSTADQAEFHGRAPGAPTKVPEPVVGSPSDATPLATARGAGFPTTASNIALRNPTQQPSAMEQLRELAQGGNATLTAGNNAKSTAVATRLAGQQMGLGDDVTKINPPDLRKAKVAPGKVYDDTGAALSDFTPSPNLMNQLKDAASDNSVQASPAARTNANRILTTIDQNKGQYNGSELVGDISKLRESPNTRPVALLLDKEIERQLQAKGDGPGLQRLLDARQKFAQIYTVQDALSGGQVDAQQIGAVHQANPHLLTGNLRLIGTAAQELPADVRLPTSADSTVDSLINGTKSLLGAPARMLLNTDKAQERFGPVANEGGRSYFPNFGEKPKPSVNPLKLALAPGKVGEVTPTQGTLGAESNGAATTYARDANGKLVPTQPPDAARGVPEGPGSVSQAPMSSKAASQLIRPLGDAFQPGQRGLFDGGAVDPKWKDPGPAKLIKPKGVSDADWEKLVALGLGE